MSVIGYRHSILLLAVFAALIIATIVSKRADAQRPERLAQSAVTPAVATSPAVATQPSGLSLPAIIAPDEQVELYAKASGGPLSVIPAELWSAMPYLATVVVLVLISLRRDASTNAPACLGRPFR